MKPKTSEQIAELLAPIHEFLACETPDEWIEQAQDNLDELLIDHANCEKKAAGTALSLMFRYTHHPDLQMKMSKLAREELRHYEQVLQILKKRNITYRPLSASRYASGLGERMAKKDPEQLIDKLIMGAFIEARSCERFAKLAPHLDPELKKFYISLLKSESRHYQDYLKLAEQYADSDISERVAEFRMAEAELIESEDKTLRFHSGPVSA